MNTLDKEFKPLKLEDYILDQIQLILTSIRENGNINLADLMQELSNLATPDELALAVRIINKALEG